MSEYQNVTLRVKLDSYKDLQNFLHNELKLTKPDVEKLIEKFTSAIINEKLTNAEWIEKHIDRNVQKVVEDRISRLSSLSSWKINDKIDEAIQKCIGQYIINRVKEQMSNIKL
jgi:hypothetical protein